MGVQILQEILKSSKVLPTTYVRRGGILCVDQQKGVGEEYKTTGISQLITGQGKKVFIDYWDVFCEYGLCRPIRGFSFNIDTDNHPTI